MRKFLLSATLLISLASQGQTETSAKKEQIKNLFVLMHQDSLVMKTFDGMAAAMMKNMSTLFSDTMYTNHGVDPSELSKKFMERIMKRSKENALRLLNEDMVDIYDKHFTAEEIADFATFYKTTSGQKMLNQMPDITKDIMTVMGQKYQKDFQKALKEDIEEITNEMTKQTKAKKK